MYIVGQRWISEAETDLGLGLVQSVDFRAVTVYFPVIDDSRTYAADNAPLTRVVFAEGDTIPLQDGSVMTITEVQEQKGIYFYGDADQFVAETHLSGNIQLNSPADRLFTGQIDKNNLYELRQTALQRLAKLRQRPFYGLLGARTSLLAHQLYIAEQVTQDAIPRVLLADEVGLGKTIEAGLILHRLLLQQRIQRVLILVPDHLLHQWLVEMTRRFNLRFAVVNHAAIIEEDDLFESDQLFLCPLSMATEDDVAAQILTSDWDMLIVDEAHHLEWTPESQDASYSLVEHISTQAPGLLLLTATPEQLGIAGHFARLRLLDPQRYTSLDRFIEEQQAYQPIAELAAVIASDQELSASQQTHLLELLPDLGLDADRNRQLDALIDRHGPGRALYRNTRHGVTGFPKRVPNITILPCPQDYEGDGLPGLYPEIDMPNWCDLDPRAEWLHSLLKTNPTDKVVLICHKAATVLDIEAYLWETHRIQVAVFHEQMDLVERDRAAAYFADQEQGAKLLLCSEIGSEGRNFQFARHLVLFDLPLNCDLIEQRIGRLDRIGQKHDIQIHIPVFEGHITQQWATLLNEGLDALSRPNPAAQSLLERNRLEIETTLNNAADLTALTQKLAAERTDLLAALEAGRDRLLELHSCHPTRARKLALDMSVAHIEDEADLNDFLELFADAFGLELIELGGDCITIAPGDHMLVPDMPHLPEDGFMATTRREVALARDDVQFLSWEHPFVDQALELITSSPAGNAAVGYVDNHEFKTGDCYLQLQFAARCPAPKALRVERYLPPDAMHLTMTPKGDLKVNEPECAPFVLPLKRGTGRGLLEQKEAEIKPLIARLEKMGSNQLGKMIERARNKADVAYTDRKARLLALAEHNRNISPAILAAVDVERAAVLAAIEDAQLVLDSVRVVFCG